MAKGKFALGAIIGAIAGGIAGILTAPKSGKETRADLKDKAGKAKLEAELKASKVKLDAQTKLDDASRKAHEKLEEAKAKKEELQTRSTNAIEGAKKGFNKKV